MKNAIQTPLTGRVITSLLSAAVLTGLLTACSHVPVRSVPALAAIDFETTQFNALRAAVEMPRFLVPEPDSVRLNVTLTIEGTIAEERSYVLREMAATHFANDLPNVEEDRHAFVYALSHTDQMGLDAIRRSVETAKANRQSGSLSLGIEVQDICTTETPDDGPLRVDVFLMTSETGRFIRTLDGFDLREVTPASFDESLPRC